MGNIENILNAEKGKTIAIVYIFEKEDAPGSQHYWIWKSDIITGWMNAIQELSCLPFILDVRTFVQKAIDRTLPTIDFVINLNCGSYELSSMSLVPSICSFLAIPCIPCNAVSIVTSENKQISNLLASAAGLNVPSSIDRDNDNGIFRPLNLGSSIGVKKGPVTDKNICGTYQEFIPGYDITFPMAYNSFTEDIDLLPPILYIPNSFDPNWIYDEETKKRDEGFSTIPVIKIDNSIRKALIDFAHIFPIQTFGRIDARIRCKDRTLSKEILKRTIVLEDLYFIEINSMPTIEKEDTFEYAFEAAFRCDEHSFYKLTNEYKKSVPNSTINGFLLLCSMASFTRATCRNQMG